jgi:hypothetical protein
LFAGVVVTVIVMTLIIKFEEMESLFHAQTRLTGETFGGFASIQWIFGCLNKLAISIRLS